MEKHQVSPDEDGLRLDRWFRRYFPKMSYGYFAKLVRTGQIRVDGARVKTNARVSAGQQIRVPPQVSDSPPPVQRGSPVGFGDARFIQSLVVHKDSDIIVLNKPPGIAVQGGTKTHRHIDGMLDALRFGYEDRPRLVHRLDRDTSGVLVLARTPKVASDLAEAFHKKKVEKIYWGLCEGVPTPRSGKIELSLSKNSERQGREAMQAGYVGEVSAKWARSHYSVVSQVGQSVSWLVLMPWTGRTHQLRVHCSAIGHPIVGDPKYGCGDSQVRFGGQSKIGLCLHARSISLSLKGATRTISAPLPRHMLALWNMFEFEMSAADEVTSELRKLAV